MKKIKMLTAVFAVLISTLFSGCTFAGKKVIFTDIADSESVLSVGEMRCPEEEARLYLLNYRSLYENILGSGIWDGGFDLSRLSKSVKTSVKDILSEEYALAMDCHDKGNDKLSEREKKKIEEAANEYYSLLSADEKEYLGITEDMLKDAVRKYYISQKYCRDIVSAVDSEVSEDEARVIDAFVIHIKDSQKASEANAAIGSGKAFEDIMAKYSEGPKVQISFGRNTYPKEAEDVIFNLENGEVSGLITAGGEYYIVKCISKYNTLLSEENKTKILEERRIKTILDVVENSKGKYVTSEDKEFWESAKLFSQAAGKAEGTGSFFKIVSKHLDF